MKKSRDLKLRLSRETLIMLTKSEDLAQAGGIELPSPFGEVMPRRTVATCDFGYCTQFPETMYGCA